MRLRKEDPKVRKVGGRRTRDTNKNGSGARYENYQGESKKPDTAGAFDDKRTNEQAAPHARIKNQDNTMHSSSLSFF
jgi:hypothetical protein